jgi:dTDP-4-dehydrorhamnose reductase
MRILLAGASGQLGRQIQRHGGSHQILALAHSDLDITRAADVRDAVRTVRPDVIINAAAYNNVDRAETDRDAAFAANVTGPRNLAIASIEHDAALLHVSTDYVFDGEKRAPYDENDVPNPLSVYAKTKLAGEDAVRQGTPRHFIVRTAWVYERDGKNFPRTLHALSKTQRELRVVDDVRGSPTSASHLAAAILRLIETNAFGTFHLAGAGEASWFELATAFFRALGSDVHLIPVPSSEFPLVAPRPRYSVLRTIREPRIVLPPWQDGIAEFARQVKALSGDSVQ